MDEVAAADEVVGAVRAVRVVGPPRAIGEVRTVGAARGIVAVGGAGSGIRFGVGLNPKLGSYLWSTAASENMSRRL